MTSIINLSIRLFLSLIVGTKANDSLPTKNFPFGIVPQYGLFKLINVLIEHLCEVFAVTK